MQRYTEDGESRIYSFDNIRYLVIIFVVVYHSAFAYCSYSSYWPVADQIVKPFDFLIRNLDIFMMPTLFFISGFFVLSSLNRKGAFLFLSSKFRRLGIPLLFGIILFSPIKRFIHLFSRGDHTVSLWGAFVQNIREIFSFYTGYIKSPEQFDLVHFWFISLLLLYFIVVFVLFGIWRKFFPNQNSKNVTQSTNRSILFILLILAAFSTFFTIISNGLISKAPIKNPWFIILNLVQFRPSQIGLCTICFVCGIYAAHKKWFVSKTPPGSVWFWVAISVILLFSKAKIASYLLENPSPGIAVFLMLIRTFFFFSIFLMLISIGFKYFNSNSRINRLLAANSYNIYIFHLFFILLFQLLLLNTTILIPLKFLTVLIASFICSYVFSQYFVRPYPQISMFSILVLFFISIGLVSF